MDMDSIRDLAQRAIANADDGLRRVAVVVNEGVDQAREGVRKTSLANKLTKDIHNCIKELEKSNKTVTPGNVHDDTEALIEKLSNEVKLIKDDPYNCVESLDSLIDEFCNAKEYMLDNNTSPEEMLEMTVMRKHYDSAIRACQNAKSLAEEEREAAELAAAEKSTPTVIQLNGSEIQILIPDGYEQVKYNKLPKKFRKALSKEDVILSKTTERSNNTIVIKRIVQELAIIQHEKQTVIDDIHKVLEDNQGLIEVEEGKTKRDYDYLYGIVKTIKEDMGGAIYFLNMNLQKGSEIIEIQGSFEEIGMTGERDSFGYAMASNAGLVSHNEDGGFSGWNEDPYDPEYTKGIPMNLSERSGLDGLFPYHPLTQAREFLLAAIEDKFVIQKKEDEGEAAEETVAEEEAEKNDNKEMLMNLFAKDPVYTRHTVDIEV